MAFGQKAPSYGCKQIKRNMFSWIFEPLLLNFNVCICMPSSQVTMLSHNLYCTWAWRRRPRRWSRTWGRSWRGRRASGSGSRGWPLRWHPSRPSLVKIRQSEVGHFVLKTRRPKELREKGSVTSVVDMREERARVAVKCRFLFRAGIFKTGNYCEKDAKNSHSRY